VTAVRSKRSKRSAGGKRADVSVRLAEIYARAGRGATSVKSGRHLHGVGVHWADEAIQPGAA